ncbi:PAS domain-containing protein, partial [Acidihalobacter prosperus]
MRNAALDSIEIQSILGEHTEEAAYLVDADDPTQPIITCNKALCRLYGFAPDSLCGKSWRHLHLGPQNDAKQIKLVDETSQAIHDNHPRVLTLVGYHQDGQKLLTRLRLIKLDPARSGMSHNRHFMGIIETDVSELFHINQLAYEQGRLLSV